TLAPHSCGDELYGSEVVFGALVIPGCDASKLLDPIEEPFHEIALPIDPAREHEGTLAITFRWDVGPGFSLGGLGPNGVRVIALAGQEDAPFAKLIRQRVSFGTVGNLSASQTQIDRATFGIDERVDFARKPAAGTSHATIVSI